MGALIPFLYVKNYPRDFVHGSVGAQEKINSTPPEEIRKDFMEEVVLEWTIEE